MPREAVKITQRVESLAILAADGTVDAALEPDISDVDLRRLYKTMLTSRRMDERCLMLQRQGRMGTYGPSKGQEAASLGVAYALDPDDWFVPAFREPAGMLWRGWPMHSWMLYWGGHEAGNEVPAGVRDLPVCVPIASQCLHGMGIAWGCKLRGAGRVCVTFCGDGATSEGDFHEALNFAGVYNLPLITVVQNNHWAISIPRSQQTASPTIAQKAVAYGFDALYIDGNDLLAVIVATREAVTKARTGGGPTLIEAVTYRLSVHTTADDPKRYRLDEEVQCWEPRDPLTRFRTYLLHKGVLTPKAEKLIEEEIVAELDEATRIYEEHGADPLAFFDFMFAELTPELAAQKAELRAYLASRNTPAAPRDLSRV
ncbi:MAG: pyruvate dehydrogenase (acetyl-transferring) E1 component subunit alpha [Phycisphaerales bacterium]|nr:pyruvate dehydrogenase (acetyl-transferring) E1 component subunit alpha [Phycisphaerales bacterium]